MGMAALRFELRSVAPGDVEALAELRAFARAELLERAHLHAGLEARRLRARTRFLRASFQGRLAGAASVLERAARGRAVAVAATLPGAATALLERIERPFIAFAAERHRDELVRAGGRLAHHELQLARLVRGPLPPRDERVEKLGSLEELAAFPELRSCTEPGEPGSWLGLRVEGELVAAGGLAWVTERLACIAAVATLATRRAKGYGRALGAELVRGVESEGHLVIAQVPEDDRAAVRFAAGLDFRGTRRFGLWLFGEPAPSGS